jgi:putative NIF3 family GTP cyclohydrolase 1 type 2
MVGASSLLNAKAISSSSNSIQPLSISDVIAIIKKEIPLDISKGTVDTIKIGNPDQPVTGIVTTMFATLEVINKAIALKANFIIAHEPTFYNHLDETKWLEEHDVYQYKKDLINKHNIAVWRFHDYWHANRPDGILMGVLTSLGWEKSYNTENTRIVNIPQMKLEGIIKHAKSKLGIKTLRYIGDPNQLCKKIALLPGASGGRGHMNVLQKEKPDLLIVGELQEWETSEYVRDLQTMGRKQSLIVLGHAVSEEPGMNWLVQWLQPKVSQIKVTHIASNNPFSWA